MNIHNGMKTKILCYMNNHITGKNRINPRPNVAIWERYRRSLYQKKGNALTYGLSDCRRCTFDFRGKNNMIELGNTTLMRNVEIAIIGDGNYVQIGRNCGIYNITITVEGNHDRVIIGNGCHFFCGDERGIIMGGHKSDVVIGDDCLFAPGIVVRSHDAHSIIDIRDGHTINQGHTVYIGNHVWLATRAMVYKGSEIEYGSVVGSNTFISNKKIPSNCLVVGNPCSVIKEGISWKM